MKKKAKTLTTSKRKQFFHSSQKNNFIKTPLRQKHKTLHVKKPNRTK